MLSRDWIQSEALRAIKSNASPACSCLPEARPYKALDRSEGREQSLRVGGMRVVSGNPGCEARKTLCFGLSGFEV